MSDLLRELAAIVARNDQKGLELFAVRETARLLDNVDRMRAAAELQAKSTERMAEALERILAAAAAEAQGG